MILLRKLFALTSFQLFLFPIWSRTGLTVGGILVFHTAMGQIEDFLDISGTWSQRPVGAYYEPTAPDEFPGNTEVYFEDQVCVMRLGGLGTCGIAAWVYGRDFITLNRDGEMRTVVEDGEEHYELDFTGAYHHVHSLPRVVTLTGGYWHHQSSKQGWKLDDGVELVYQLTGTVQLHPEDVDHPFRVSLDGVMAGEPPLTHGVEVGMGYQGPVPVDGLSLGRQFREEFNVFGWAFGDDRYDGRDTGPFTPLYKAYPDTVEVKGRVLSRASGIPATSGTVFVYGTDPEKPLGMDGLDEDGYFLITDVPLLRTRAQEGLPPGVALTRLTLKIDDAASEIPPENQRLFGGPVVYYLPGEVETHPFFPEEEIRLDPFPEPAIKRRIATRLSELSKNHYKEAEEPVFPFLDSLEADGITDVETDGLRRAIWAERIFLEAGLDAQTMLTGMIGGIAGLFGNLWDEFYSKKSDELNELAEVNAKVEALKDLDPDSIELKTFLKFGLQEGDEGFETALGSMMNSLSHEETARIAQWVKALFKAAKADISFSFQEAGVEPELAAQLGDFFLWVLDLGFRSVLALVQNQSFAGSLKPLGGTVIQGVINATAPVLFDNHPGDILSLFPGTTAFAGVFPSYAKSTVPDLQETVTDMVDWEMSNPEQYEADADIAAQTLVNIQNRYTLVKQRVDAASTFTDVADASADLAELADKIPVMKAIFVLAKVVQYTSNVCAIVEPARFTFAYLPEQVAYGVGKAYGKEVMEPAESHTLNPLNLCSVTVDAMIDVVEFFDDKANYVLHGQSVSSGLPHLQSAILFETSAKTVSILDAGDRYIAALASLAQDLNTGNVVAASLSSGSQASELALAERAWSDLKAGISLVSSSAPAAAWETVGTLVSDQLMADLVELTLQAGLRQEVSDLAIDVIFGSYADPSEAAFVERVSSIAATIDRLTAEIVTQQDRLAQIEAGVPEFDAAMVQVDAPLPVSTSSGRAYVTEQNEEFVISATVRNLGNLPAGDISVALTPLYDETVVTLLTPGEVSLPGNSLAACDGVEGGGPDEVTVEWTVRYVAERGTLPVLFDLAVLENGGQPLSFGTYDQIIELPIDFRFADVDGDGVSDEFEIAYGLDTAADDAEGDSDEDGLTNFEEYKYGLSPKLADSDGDGLRDADEVGTTFDPRVDDTESLRLLAAYPELYAGLVETRQAVHPVFRLSRLEEGKLGLTLQIEATENFQVWETLDLTAAIVNGTSLSLTVPASESTGFLQVLGSRTADAERPGELSGEEDADGDSIRDADEVGTTFEPGEDDSGSLAILAAYPDVYAGLVGQADGVYPNILIARDGSGGFPLTLKVQASNNLNNWQSVILAGAVVQGDSLILEVPASDHARYWRILGYR